MLRASPLSHMTPTSTALRCYRFTSRRRFRSASALKCTYFLETLASSRTSSGKSPRQRLSPADSRIWAFGGRQGGVSGRVGPRLLSVTPLYRQKRFRPFREAGIRVVSLVHELPALMRRYGIVEAARVAAREADAVVFASSYVRDRFVGMTGPVAGKEVVRAQGLYTVPHDEQHLLRLRAECRAQLRAVDVDPVILGGGGGDLRKGLDLWPILMLKVLARHPRALFVWAGSIEPEVLAWLRHDLEVAGLSERLRILGPVEDMRPLYAAADIFLLTSREDPFPSVILEAMAHAVPVVAFEGGGGYSDLIDVDGLVPYLDVEAMSAAICRLLDNPALRRTNGEAAKSCVARDFAFADYAFDLLRLAFPALRKVSVVVPNYNYARYLRIRLESVWHQTYPIYEVIVLDDASEDGSMQVLEELQREFGRTVRIVRNAINSGAISRQWARGVDLAAGDLVWLAEADDFADPRFLATVIEAFDDPAVVLSYCQSRQIDEKGVVLAEHYLDYVGDVHPKRWWKNYQCSGMDEITEALAVKNTIPNVSAAVFHRETLARVLHDHLEELAVYRNAADWVCYLRLLAKGGSIAFTAEPLNNHRRHRRSNTIAANDRRHLEEITMVQQLAASLTSIGQERRQAARAWRLAVAQQFGLDLAETEDEAAAVSDVGLPHLRNQASAGPLVPLEELFEIAAMQDTVASVAPTTQKIAHLSGINAGGDKDFVSETRSDQGVPVKEIAKKSASLEGFRGRCHAAMGEKFVL